jgi:hypothetical protein
MPLMLLRYECSPLSGMLAVGCVLMVLGARAGSGETDGEARPAVECAETTDENGYATSY